MKRILLSLVTIVSMSQAIENWNDIKPHSYGRNNLTINILPGTLQNEIESGSDSVKRSVFKTFGIGIHSKASLKEFHYKQADFFWAGGVDWKLYKQEDLNGGDTEYSDLDANIEFGLALNLGNLIYSGVLGGRYNYSDPTSDSDTAESTGTPFIYGEAALAYDFRTWTIGGIYKIEQGSYSEGYRGISQDIDVIKQTITIPLQYNVDRNTAVAFTPSYSVTDDRDSTLKETEYKFIIGFTWLYGLD